MSVKDVITTINKDKMARILQEKLGFSYVLCEAIVTEIFDQTTNLVINQGKLTLKNFGQFRLRHKKARTAINQKTKEKMILPPRKVVSFLPSKNFKNFVNNVTNGQ